VGYEAEPRNQSTDKLGRRAQPFLGTGSQAPACRREAGAPSAVAEEAEPHNQSKEGQQTRSPRSAFLLLIEVELNQPLGWRSRQLADDNGEERRA